MFPNLSCLPRKSFANIARERVCEVQKGYLNQGLPRPTAGLSGKSQLGSLPFLFSVKVHEQLAQLPIFSVSLKDLGTMDFKGL